MATNSSTGSVNTVKTLLGASSSNTVGTYIQPVTGALSTTAPGLASGTTASGTGSNYTGAITTTATNPYTNLHFVSNLYDHEIVSGTSTTVVFKSLVAGNNITLTPGPNYTLKIAASLSGGGGSGVTEFTQLSDAPSSYTGAANKYVAVNSSANGLTFISPPATVSDFIQLADVPNSYTGAANKYVAVNSSGNGLIFVSGGGSIPTNLIQVYSFTVHFDSNGVISTLSGLPSGWSYAARSGFPSYVDITHNVGSQPLGGSSLGTNTDPINSAATYTLISMGSSLFNLFYHTSSTTVFTMYIQDASSAGSTTSGSATINIMFLT